MAALIIPEITIETTLEAILASISANWDANVDKTKTALYRMLFGLSHGNYNYYTQAQEIFLRTSADKRKIKIKSSYPTDKQEFPFIIVNNPNRGKGGVNTLGFNLNSSDISFETDSFTENTGRSFESTHSILIFSDNKEEAQLIYYVLEAFFFLNQIKDHLELSGLRNINISGRELQIMTDLPNKTFVRALQISYFTEQRIDDLTANSMLSNISFGGLYTDFSLNKGLIGVDSFSYLGGQGSNIISFEWLDNSDNSGNANSNDLIYISIFNYSKNEWFSSIGDAKRIDEIISIYLPTTYSDGDSIIAYAKFVKINSIIESEQSSLTFNFEV